MLKKVQRPSESDIKLGWRISYKEIETILEQCKLVVDSGYIGLEQVESVVLTLINLGYLDFDWEK